MDKCYKIKIVEIGENEELVSKCFIIFNKNKIMRIL